MAEPSRWRFLEEEPDACGVLTGRMEVVYLNAPARGLVPADWWGKRCWDVFPVEDKRCAASCPAARAVNGGGDIVYCEETLSLDGESTLVLGVAVIPLTTALEDRAKAVLLMRPRSADQDMTAFQAVLVAAAHGLSRRFG